MNILIKKNSLILKGNSSKGRSIISLLYKKISNKSLQMKVKSNKNYVIKTINFHFSSKDNSDINANNININNLSDNLLLSEEKEKAEFNLKLNEEEKLDFDAFYAKMKENIDSLVKMSEQLKENPNADVNQFNLKDEDLLHLKKSQEILNKASQKSDKTAETFDTMTNLKDTVVANRGKFVMPFFWGWASPFVKWGSIVLLTSQQFTGLPWLPFFVLSGVVVRMLIFPLLLKQMILIQRMAKVSPNIRLLSYCVMKCDLPMRLKTYYYIRAVLKYSKDVNVNLFTFAAYNVVQLPIFLLMVWSIRKIATEEDLTNKGILWFPNLNEADPYMILPIISVVVTYFNLGRGINKDNEHWFINKWRSFFQVLQIFYLPFTCQWPVGSHIYWITSSLMANLQNYITKHPVVMSKINPTFYIDMQKVFQSERNKADSERYVEKLKNCEDPIIKSPTNDNNVLYEMDYERTRMISLQKMLRYKNKLRKYNENFIDVLKKPFRNSMNLPDEKK